MQKACTSIVFTTGNIAGSNTIGLLNGHSDKSRNFNYFSMLLFVQRNRSVPWYHSLVALHTVVKHHVPGYDARAGFWIPNFQNWHPNDVWNLWKTGQHSSVHKMWTFMPSGQASMESSYKLVNSTTQMYQTIIEIGASMQARRSDIRRRHPTKACTFDRQLLQY